MHIQAAELAAATAREGIRARARYRPPMWAHRPDFVTCSAEGESWLGFEAVRDRKGLPAQIQVGLRVGLFERVVTTDKRLRLYNQGRLRRFTAAHPEVTVFAAHDPGGFPPTKPRHAERAGVFSYSAASGVSPQRGRPSRAECTSAPSMYETEGAKMRSCCPIPAFTRCPQKAGSYPHVTAVIHWLIHTLLTTHPE